MKTKISHLGRSTVSVILAVMMLLSTMLIGTVSTVNATVSGLSEIYFTPSKKWQEGYANFRLNVQDSSNNWHNITMTKVDENIPIYKGELDSNTTYNVVQFLRYSGDNTTQWDSSKSCSDIPSGMNYYTMTTETYRDWAIDNTNGTWSTYSGGSGGGSTSTDYYIAGRFKTSWNADTTEYKFTESSEQKGLYYYDTEETVASLSGQIPEGIYGNYDRYFYIRSSNGKYLTSDDKAGHSFQNKKNSQNYLTLVTNEGTPEERLIKFSDPSDPSNDKVTIWLDTTNNDMRLYYTAGSESSLTPVAQSVSLTASSSPVQVGTEVTLTASLNDRATGLNDTDVTYKFEQTSGATVTGTPNGNTYKFTPATADDYTFKVTASAANYSSVTNTVKVTATSDSSDKYAIHVKLADNVSSYSFSLWAYGAPNNTNAYGYNNWDSKETFTINDHEWHDYPFINTISNWNLIIFNNGTEKKYDGQYNSDLWVTVKGDNNYDVSTIAPTKYTVTYGVNGVNGTLSATGVSGSGSTVNSGTKVTFTANPSKGYAVEGWYSDAKCTNKIETAGTNKTYTVTVNADANVYVKFRTANTYTVKFSSSDDNFGTVSATNGTTSLTSPATVTEGDTVTFTAKPKDGYALSDWTVTANGTSETRTDSSLSLEITANTTVTANFKVEDSGTIVNDMYFLYGSTNNPTSWEGQQGYNKPGYGKYNVYKKDGKYIVTLNKEHYKQLYFAFSTSNYYKNMTPKDKLAGVNPDNPVDLSLVTTSKEIFNADNTQYVFGRMSIENENSEYIGDIKIIYDPTANTYTVKATKDSVSDTTVNITGKDGTIRAGFTNTGDKKTTAVLGDTTLSITTPDKEIIDASPSYPIDGENRAVTAKKVPYGSTVTVTTTIKPDATFAGHSGSDYYVKGFSINGFTGGVLTQQAGNSHEGNVYEYTFTVKEDVYADVSTIEITPIYFLKDDSDCVTFYVENFMDAKDKWGDTIACYAYYSSDHALGDYPGQPMVNAEGSIYMQIPKHIGDNKSNVVKGITLNNYVWDFVHVSGGEDVRKSKNCQTYDYDDFKYLANMSTVNSSDSVDNIKNIVYRFKYHTYNNTSADAGNVPNDTLTGTKVDDTKYEVFVDYYDKPTDIFGTIIKGNDAVTVETVKAQEEYLTIVSDGYVNYSKDYLGQYATKWYIYNNKDQKVAALPPSALLYGLTKSSTELENLVNKEEVPRDFMSDSGASPDVISDYWASFKSLYTKYAGKYAIINYESSIHSSGRDGAEIQPGERCDGRWYYSVDKANITGDIKIEYADTLDSFTTMTGVKTDTFIEGTATGTNTAAEAYFTSPADQSTAVKPTHVETTSDNSENFMFTVGATSSTTSGYTFVGWYRLIDDTYKAVNDPSELNKTTGQVARNANVVLVARYIKTPGGSMTFHHSLYNGINAGGGKATTKIQVVVKPSDGGKEYYNSGIIDSTASIDQKTISEIVAGQKEAKITVTLYTTTKNLYNFNGYYSAENTTDITAFKPTSTPVVSGDRKNGLVTKLEYTFSFNDYYKTHQNTLIGPDAGTVYYNFYSDITSIKVPYKVQFSYTDRMGNQKYYNRAGYVDPENTSSYTIVEDTTNGEGVESHPVKVTLTDSFILTLAPYESNFAKDLTWKETPDINTPFDSLVTNSIASAVVNSTQSDKKIYLNVFRDKDGRPTPRTNTAGAFKFFEKDGSAKLPYGSVFYTKKDDGTYKYDITAPKTYEGKQFMYWAIYSDSRCRNEDLVIKAYNSEGHFSYVAYDNCWIVPVYGESSTPVASVKDVSTSTQFMEVTRNQWTADKNSNFEGFNADSMTTLDKADDFIKIKGEDKLYADFVLNFFYNGKQLSVFDPNSDKVKAGVLIQRLELDENETGTGCITDLNHYANKYNEADLEQAKNDAIQKITTGNSVIKSVKQPIANSKLDNKNRLHYYTIFNNVKGNNNCVFRLYTYIQYTNASGETAVQLSNPVYFTFFDIANKS